MKLEELDFKLKNIKEGFVIPIDGVSSIDFFEGTVTVEINENGDDKTYPINEFEILRNTECNTVDGEPIYEGDIVNQRSVLIGDEGRDFTGEVKCLEGQWLIIDDENKLAIPLWSEHRENRIVNN